MNNKKIISALVALSVMPQMAFAATNYKVQKGDTYWLISQKFDTTLSKVLEENNASLSSVLNIGDIIRVPSSTYTVQKGDTYWLIANKCGVSLNELLNVNNANENSALYVGDKIKIPTSGTSNKNYHTVQKGDTYWLISKKYGISLPSLLSANNATESSVLNIGDKVLIPSGQNGGTQKPSGNYITYETYTVKQNDTLWSIAIDCKIPMAELLSANNMTESSYVYAGMKLKYPVHHIAVKETVSANHGELLDWFSEAQYVIPINSDFTIFDFATGKSFRARRTVGSGHADCEPLTASDTAKMREIFGGTFSWKKRSVLVLYNGRKIAASMAGMLHAGNESAPGGAWTSWRSDNYGAGTNYDYVKGNNADGHFDLYFYNSIGHSSGVINEMHQSNIRTSAGLN